jgi:general stress protein YciG
MADEPKKTGGMTVREAGRKGGQKVRDERGHKFYEEIGRKGGETVRNERGHEFYEEAAAAKTSSSRLLQRRGEARKWLLDLGAEVGRHQLVLACEGQQLDQLAHGLFERGAPLLRLVLGIDGKYHLSIDP